MQFVCRKNFLHSFKCFIDRLQFRAIIVSMQNRKEYAGIDSLSDEELAVRSGTSIAAEEVLISRYARLIRACARPLFLSGGDHEDLVQEGMIGLLYAIRSYSPETGTPFQAYALVCIRNKLFSAVRAAAANKHAPLNESVSFHFFSSDEPVPERLRVDPEAELIGREDANELLNALRFSLTASEKAVLSLFLQGLSYAEIASARGKTVKSVDNTVQRIRRKAAKILGEGGNAV